MNVLILAVAFALSLSPLSAKPKHPNVLMICVDDLRPELNCFGVDYVRSPNIDGLAARGRPFHRHYVQAPTCGASRYTLLTGTCGPTTNGALFSRAGNRKHSDFPGFFRKHGYVTVSVGKVSHHPGGRGGSNWDDDTKHEMPESWDRHLMPTGLWKHPRGAMHGLANGEIRSKAWKMDVYQTFDGPDNAYPDGLIVEEALRQLDHLGRQAAGKPFFLAVGIIRPHLPFGAPLRYVTPYLSTTLPPTPHPLKPSGKTTWHNSGEFMKYNRWKRNPNTDAAFALEIRRHYAGCVTYADALVGRILARLKQLKLEDNTIVVLWGDHGWHLGEHAVWGKHTLFEESLRSPLIISYKGIPKPGTATRSVVETLDIFPTVCALAGLDSPDFLQGRSLIPILNNPKSRGHSAIAYRANAQTIRTATHRLIAHSGGELELYDHTTPQGETKNLAATQPGKAGKLLRQLTARLEKN